MLTPGSTLGGRYQITERIAGGGMGEVWKAEDTVLGRTIALKVLLPTLLAEPGFVERFRGEARIMATINHPGVVDVYDFGESDLPGGGRVAYLVMEYVRGEPLSQVLANVGRLTASQTMAFVAQTAEALQAAHDVGITHRDVKPANLLVRPNGTLVLTDFGIARSQGSANLTEVGSTLGTAAYMSPEQASGQPVGPLSDVYSLGVVAYQCVSGHVPFEADNPLTVALMHVNQFPPPLPDDVPPRVKQFIERAIAKQDGARWPSATAMAAAARTAAAGTVAGTAAAARTVVAGPVADGGLAPTTIMPPIRPIGQGAPTVSGVSRRRKGPMIVALLSVAVGSMLCVGVGYAMNSQSGQGGRQAAVVATPEVPPADTYSPSPQSSPPVAIDCESMRDRSYSVVERKLKKLGLVPEKDLVASRNEKVKEGYVLDVPCQAEAGSTVKVQVADKQKNSGDSDPSLPAPSKTPKSAKPTPTTETDHQENAR